MRFFLPLVSQETQHHWLERWDYGGHGPSYPCAGLGPTAVRLNEENPSYITCVEREAPHDQVM